MFFRSESAVGDGWHNNRSANWCSFSLLICGAQFRYCFYPVKPTSKHFVAEKMSLSLQENISSPQPESPCP